MTAKVAQRHPKCIARAAQPFFRRCIGGGFGGRLRHREIADRLGLVTDKPPKGSRIIGEGGRVEIFGGTSQKRALRKKLAKKKKSAKKA